MADGGHLSYWLDGERWLTAGEASRLWRDLTTMDISESTWRRMADDGRLLAMGLRLSDDHKLTNKLSIIEHLMGTLTTSLKLVQVEQKAEMAAMKARQR